jgi:hypothetical protein
MYRNTFPVCIDHYIRARARARARKADRETMDEGYRTTYLEKVG